LLYSIEEGEFHWPAHVETLFQRQGENEYLSFRRVGRHWIAFEEYDGYHVTTPFLYEWHDGRTELRNPMEAGRSRSVVDLDEPDAFERMCRPLRRYANPYARPDSYPDEEPFFTYRYVEPFGLGRQAGGHSSFFLQRCGSRGRRHLAGSKRVVGITRRVAYWTDGYKLNVLVLRSARLLVYDFSEGRPAESAGFSIAGTAKRLYVEVGESGETVTTLPGYVLRTPRR